MKLYLERREDGLGMIRGLINVLWWAVMVAAVLYFGGHFVWWWLFT